MKNVCIHKIIAHLRGARNHVPCHMWHSSYNRGYYLIIWSSSLLAMNLHTFSVPSNRWINLGSGKEKYPTLRIHGVTHPKIIHQPKVTLMCTFFSCSPVDVMFFFSFTILGCMQFHQLVWVFPTHSYHPMGQVTNMRDLPTPSASISIIIQRMGHWVLSGFVDIGGPLQARYGPHLSSL